MGGGGASPFLVALLSSGGLCSLRSSGKREKYFAGTEEEGAPRLKLCLPAAARSQGLGEVEGRDGHPQSQHVHILCSEVGRTLGLPQGNWAPHPRTSLEIAEGTAGRLATWQLEPASQSTPPHQHTHTEDPSVKAGRRQASQAPSFLQAHASRLISGFCEMRREEGRGECWGEGCN